MDKKLLDKIGGVEYLLQLSESVPTTAHSQYYLKILNEKSLLRKLIQQSTQIIENAYGEVEHEIVMRVNLKMLRLLFKMLLIAWLCCKKQMGRFLV